MPFDSIDQALEDIRQGKLIIVADDEDRENEGDLVCAASLVTPATVNFMTQFGRGLICVALTPPRATALGLPLMTDENSDPQGTAFTISVDAHQRFGVTTGISAHDRAKTIEVLVNPETEPGDLRASRDTSFPSRPDRAVFFAAWARRRLRWTWRGWPGCLQSG